jgi:hypothetical protein
LIVGYFTIRSEEAKGSEPSVIARHRSNNTSSGSFQMAIPLDDAGSFCGATINATKLNSGSGGKD